MADYQQTIKTLTPEVYQSLKRAVELGKWPNGERLSEEQRKTCLQAVIAYDQQHKPETERVGFIHTKKHQHCGESGDLAEVDEPRPVKWK